MTKNKKFRIGFTYNLKSDFVLRPNDPPDLNAELDNPATIDAVTAALESAGHTVVKIGNISNLLKIIDNIGVDMVFNICEGISGRNRESQVPMLLELKGIPFVGADALTLGVTLDKIVAKNILKAYNIPTPGYITIEDASGLDGVNLKFPLIVKPRFEGSSKGLTDDSLVKNKEALKKQSGIIIERYKQPALVEEFISGTEFTIALIGNKKPRALPSVQFAIDGKLDLGDLFYKFEFLHSNNIEYICPAQISKETEKKLQNLAVFAYKVTECRDFGRVDIRVDKHGNPYVLEVNPLPSLVPIDAFGVIGQYLGVGYDRLILDILDAAVERNGL